MKEGNSWAARLGGTGGKTGGSRSVMETVEKREEGSCYCVDRTLSSAHGSRMLRSLGDTGAADADADGGYSSNTNKAAITMVAGRIVWINSNILPY